VADGLSALDPDDVKLQLDVALVKAPAPPPVLVVDGPMRTPGRAFEAPPPPDELHVTFTRRPPPLIWFWLIALPIAALWLTSSQNPVAAMFAVLPFLAILIAVSNDQCRLVASHQRIAFRRALRPWSSWRVIPVKTIESLDLAARWPFGFRLVLRAGGRTYTLHRTRSYTEISRLKDVLEDRLRLGPPPATPAPSPALPDAPAKLR
jgi:hypothetical protein